MSKFVAIPDVDSLFDSFFNNDYFSNTFQSVSRVANGTNRTVDNGDGTVSVLVEVPGFSKELLDVRVSTNQNGDKRLKISGELEGSDDGRFVKRSVNTSYLLKGFDTDNIEATLNNGVLDVVVKRSEKSPENEVKIEIK